MDPSESDLAVVDWRRLSATFSRPPHWMEEGEIQSGHSEAAAASEISNVDAAGGRGPVIRGELAGDAVWTTVRGTGLRFRRRPGTKRRSRTCEAAVIRLVEWLLDLQNIQLARDAPLSIRWARPAPAWALFCFALVAATVLASTYRRERTTVPRRSLLLAIRALIVALVVAALCQPMLVLQRNRVEPSYVAMLLDTSMSMAATDAYVDEELADRVAAGAGVADAAELVGRTRLDLVEPRCCVTTPTRCGRSCHATRCNWAVLTHRWS